jgi:PilZ domain
MLRRLKNGARPVRRLSARIRAGASRMRPLGERRRSGRLKGRSLRCNRGEVMDLSAGGLRIRSSRRYSSKLPVQLWTPTRRVTVPAQVRWVKRLGFRKYEIGLQFYDLTPEQANHLTAFATYLSAG